MKKLKKLDKAVRGEAAVEYLGVRGHGRDDVRDACQRRGVIEAEVIGKIVRLIWREAVEHEKKREHERKRYYHGSARG